MSTSNRSAFAAAVVLVAALAGSAVVSAAETESSIARGGRLYD